jgi:hypothetical protein
VHCIHASENLGKFRANYLKHKATEVPLALILKRIVHQSDCDEFRHELCSIIALGGRNLNLRFKFELENNSNKFEISN